MSRPLRIEYPGAFYHVMNRGLERRDIFKSPADFQYFLELLTSQFMKYGLIVHAYCLMSNHYHLFIETPLGHISKIMRAVDGHYTQKFNKCYKRNGPLFQGRYKALLVDKDSYSLELSRYIHLNPVKAGMTKTPQEYPYSSYSSFLSNTHPYLFLNTSWILSQFHTKTNQAKKHFTDFTLQGLTDTWSPDSQSFKNTILGSPGFISQIQDRFLNHKHDREIPELKQSQRQRTQEDVVKYLVNVNLAEHTKQKLLVYLLKTKTHYSLKDIALISNKNIHAVSKSVSRFEQEIKQSKLLREILSEAEAALTGMSNV
ncbi:MAG TPA: transposase [Patescibacteria group bacterium]|nr:transposase [Patescibacteria group bacterium]